MTTTPPTSPDRYRCAVIAHVMLENATTAIEFYQRALGATELFRVADRDGRVVHAEISIGGAVIMVGDADPPFVAPATSGSTAVGLHVYVTDVDTALRQAEEAGGTILQPAQDMFYGDRSGMFCDPFGHIWVLLTHQEDLEPEEIQRRGQALLDHPGNESAKRGIEAAARNPASSEPGLESTRAAASATIEAPPEAVFSVLADPAAHAAIDGTGWVRQSLGVDRITSAGQVFGMAMYHEDHPDKDYKMANQVVVFDEPTAIAWKPGTESPETGELSFGGWIWRYDLEANGLSRTTVTLTYDWSAVPAHTREHIGFPPFGPDHLDNSLRHLSSLVTAFA